MREAERATQYDAHRDDPQEFIEVVETPAERGSLSVTVAVQFSAVEAEALQRTAQREGKTYAEIVRTAVQRYTQPTTVLEPDRENHSPATLTESNAAGYPA